MRKIIFFIYVICIINCSYAEQNKIGSIFFGTHTLVNNTFPIYEDGWHLADCYVNKTGVNIGILLPIRISSLNIDYKVKIAHHSIHEINYHKRYKIFKYDKYSTGQNVILVGKSINIDNNNYFIPQIGFGVIVETIWENRQFGHIYSELLYDLSVQYKHKFDHFYCGLIVDFEKGFWTGYEEFKHLNRFNISLQISK